MKTFAAALLVILLEVTAIGAKAAGYMEVEMVPQVSGSPLVLDVTRFKTRAAEEVRVSRLDFLVSDWALRREDGTWCETQNWQSYVSVGDGRTVSRLGNVPRGLYSAVRFHVGLAPEVNHRDPAQIPAGHALNPEVNGLHWDWRGGYIFLALEGRWSSAETRGGYSFHVANDPQLMQVELPVNLDLRDRDCLLRLSIDVEGLFNDPHVIRMADANSTHSRDGDAVAGELRENVEHAFSVLGVGEPAARARTPQNVAGLPAGATPYRLTFSRAFPIPNLPRDNPLTDQGVALGGRLFSDPRLSINNAESCATCHDPASAFTDHGRRFSIGAEGAVGVRNAMPLFNLAWKKEFFWDGRAKSLREQVRFPMEDPREMHETLPAVVTKLAADPEYGPLFASAFGSPEVTAERMALALEQFLLTRISCDSRFDRAMRGEAQLTNEEQRGFQLFSTEYDPRTGQFGADCFHCHGGAAFTNHRFANNGLDAEPRDPGRYAVTHIDADKGKFAVPSLRNLTRTAPYMHDGRFQTLEEVIDHYDHGVQPSATLDPNLAKHPIDGLHLSAEDKAALVAFLKSLNDEAAAR